MLVDVSLFTVRCWGDDVFKLLPGRLSLNRKENSFDNQIISRKIDIELRWPFPFLSFFLPFSVSPQLHRVKRNLRD